MDNNTVQDEIPTLVENTKSDEEDVEAGSSKRSATDSHSIVKSFDNKYDFGTKNIPHLEPTSSRSSTPFSTRYPVHMPSFKRIDFTDLSDALVEERKPAWKLWQDSIKDSYHTVRRNAEKSVEETTFNDSQLVRRRGKRSDSPFEELSIRSPSVRRPSHHALYPQTTGIYHETGPYAAPAVFSSKGIEARYNKKASDIEAHLLKTSILPNSMKTITSRDFRNGPAPSPGSVSEAFADETDFQTFMPRPYYSRPNRDDPDYFDFDLQYSVDLYKRPEGKYIPRGPQTWEEKLLRESSSKGDAPVSTYMFTKGDTDWRTAGTSYLSAALRTPSFWEHRFQSIGREVRESNPISFDSLARNKPIPNRFTEYHDPDFEDLSDFDD
ncbi:gex interacting protein 10 [Loa loa]|uniref:Gex interacting protein 10 n=1 Tax=Loa loa TaxID=7209 RepID=A0A1I7V811_LOALO|nr:gex interacting protein 10 [Loa loa]EFO20237.1 gex interacting protein 10 [Loa loa]